MNRNRDTLFNIAERLDAKSVNTLRMASKQLHNELAAVAPESLRAVLNAGVKVSKSGDSYEFGHDIWSVNVFYNDKSQTISVLEITRQVIHDDDNYDEDSYVVTATKTGKVDFENLEVESRPNRDVYNLIHTAFEWAENNIYKFKNTSDILNRLRKRWKLTLSDVEPNVGMLSLLSMANRETRENTQASDSFFKEFGFHYTTEARSHTHSVEWVLPQVWHISLSDKGLKVEFQSEKGIKELKISSTEQSSDFTNKQTELVFNTIMNRMKDVVKTKLKNSKTKTGK